MQYNVAYTTSWDHWWFVLLLQPGNSFLNIAQGNTAVIFIHYHLMTERKMYYNQL